MPMDVVLITAAAATVAAGLAALSLGDGAASLVALLAALVLAAPLSWPLPLPGALAVRLLGATVAVLPAFLAVRRRPTALGVSPLGPLALALTALAVGPLAAALPGIGHPASRAAGAALLVLAIPVLVTAVEPLRAGTAALLAFAGGALLAEGLAGTGGTWESVALAAALAAIGIALRPGVEIPVDPTPIAPAPSEPGEPGR